MSDTQRLFVPENEITVPETPVEKIAQVVEASKNLKEDSCAILFIVDENNISINSQNLTIQNIIQINIAISRFLDGSIAEFTNLITSQPKTEEVKNDV